MKRHLVRLAAVACAALHVTACKDDVAKQLVEPGEREALMARARADEQALLADASMCRRPVVWGEATKGDGSAVFAKVLDPAQAGACRDAFATHGDALNEAFYRDDVQGWPVREVRDVRQRPGAVDALVAACRPQLDALEAAVQHEAVCSPWPGAGWSQRMDSGFSLYVLRLLKLAALVAGREFAAGEHARSVGRVLGAIRAGQDLGRRAALVDVMTGVSVSQAPLLVLEHMLGEAHLLPPALLKRVDAALDALLAGETSPHAMFRAERAQTVGYPDIDLRDAGAEDEPIDPETTKTLVLAAQWRSRCDMLAACPADANHAACYDGLKALERPGRQREAPSVEAALAMSGSPEEIRAAILKVLSGVAGPAFVKYVRLLGTRPFFLSAMKAHVASALAGCAPPAGTDPASGQPLEVKRVTDGRWMLSSAFVGSFGRLHYRAVCQKRPAAPPAPPAPAP